MTADFTLSFDAIVELVEQLPIEQKQLLLHPLQGHFQHNSLSVEEKMRLLRAAQVDVKVIQEPSPRREDWYDDNGR